MKFQTRALGAMGVLLLSLGTASAADTTTPMDANGKPAWAAGSAAQAGYLRRLLHGLHQADDATGEATPGSIPKVLNSRNGNGVSATFLPHDSVPSTSVEPFFQGLGTNGRTCLTCHQPSAGWSITPKQIQALFKANPTAPLFQMVDGAVCPTADTSNPDSASAAFKLLLEKGLIRVFIPLPGADTLQFSITDVKDPYNCTSNAATGLTSPTTGVVSQYRRSLPSTNLSFLSTIMWDGREPSLASQAADAVMIHAQGTAPPDSDTVNNIATFENALFSAQTYDNGAGDLTTGGVQAGPIALSTMPFTAGMNAPGPNFNSSVMTMFLNWNDDSDTHKAAVARGQNIFNERSFTATGVPGLTDTKPSVQVTCSACHNTPQVGGHSSVELLDLGIANAPGSVPGGTILDVSDLPVLTVHCNSGPLAGTDRQVTDLGRALITGQCADIGKLKTASLRNLSSRPPYFHNGSAPDLQTVVEFYNNRFSIGLSDQDKADLVAFLSTL